MNEKSHKDADSSTATTTAAITTTDEPEDEIISNGDSREAVEHTSATSSYYLICNYCKNNDKYKKFDEFLLHIKAEHQAEYIPNSPIDFNAFGIMVDKSETIPVNACDDISVSYNLRQLSKPALLNVIRIFSQCACLWPEFTRLRWNRVECLYAHKLLLRKLREYDEKATMQDVRNIAQQLITTAQKILNGAKSQLRNDESSVQTNINELHSPDSRVILESLLFLLFDDIGDLNVIDINKLCSFCNKSFSKYDDLWDHMKTAHILEEAYTSSTSTTYKSEHIAEIENQNSQKVNKATHDVPISENISKNCSEEGDTLSNISSINNNTTTDNNNTDKDKYKDTSNNNHSTNNNTNNNSTVNDNNSNTSTDNSKTNNCDNTNNNNNNNNNNNINSNNDSGNNNNYDENNKSKREITRRFSMRVKKAHSINSNLWDRSSTNLRQRKRRAASLPRKSSYCEATSEKSDLGVKRSTYYLNQYNDEFLMKFIDSFRQKECLWKANDNGYRNRQRKEEAYKELVNEHHKLLPNQPKPSINFIKNLIRRLKYYYKRSQSHEPKRPVARYYIWQKMAFIEEDKLARNYNVKARNLFTYSSVSLAPTSYFNCTKCIRKFKRAQYLFNHVIREHPPTVCPKCCEDFGNADNLKAHILWYHRKDTECPMCTTSKSSKSTHSAFSNLKDWKTNDHLTEHFYEHQCEDCDRIFHDYSNYTKHSIRCHQKQKNCKCYRCSKNSNENRLSLRSSRKSFYQSRASKSRVKRTKNNRKRAR